MKEIRVKAQVDPKEGLTFSGIEEVNGLINCGGKVTSITGCFLFRDDKKEGDDEHLYLSGWQIIVNVDDSFVAAGRA